MLRKHLNEALKTFSLEKKMTQLRTLRLILAAIKDRDIAKRSEGQNDGIGDQDILVLLQNMIKQRQEAIVLYEEAQRQDLVDKENKEIELIQSFLPPQMALEDIEKEVQQVIHEKSASSLKDMGEVMMVLRQKHSGAMDFSQASAFAKQILAQK